MTISVVAAPLFQQDRPQPLRHARAMASDPAFHAIDQSIFDLRRYGQPCCGAIPTHRGLVPATVAASRRPCLGLFPPDWP